MDVLLKELFTTQVGLLSLLSLGGILAIAAYLVVWVRRQMREDGR